MVTSELTEWMDRQASGQAPNSAQRQRKYMQGRTQVKGQIFRDVYFPNSEK